MNLRRLFAGSLLPLLLGLPLPSAAATPSAQNMLNTALLREWTGESMRSDISLRVGVKQTGLRTTDPSGSASLAMRFQTRQVPRTGSITGDQEGRFSIDTLISDETISEGIPLRLESPMSFQWKLVDRTAYFRVEQMPQSLLDMAEGMTQTDYSIVVGRWIKIDLDEVGATTKNDAQLKALKALAIKAPPLLVTRIESKTKAANGHDMWRLRLRVNPNFVNGLYTMAYKELPKSPANTRAAAIRELNASFVKIRAALARTGLVAVLDVTDRVLTRMELGGSYPSPVKVGNRTTGTRTVTVAVGMNMLRDDGQPVAAPADALDRDGLEALIESLQPVPEPDEEPVTGDQDLSDTQTLVAPGAGPTAVDNAVDHVLGSPTAKVTVMTYADFECPFCQRMTPDLKQLLTDFPQDVRLVYRHFPLSFHRNAQGAAEAAECAAAQGGNDAFWRMHDKLMANPTLQNRDGYLAFADQLSLNRVIFATCVDSRVQAIRVQRDIDSGVAAGVNGTPASYINGTSLEGAVPYTMLRDAVMTAGAIR